MKINTKILWISDIHYKKEYVKNANAIKLFNDFFKKLDEYKNEITHVIFTGDISFQADTDSYLVFGRNFFNRLKGCLSNDVIYLSIPGNHDVNWEKVVRMYKKNIKADLNNLFDRNLNIINNIINEDSFKDIFDGFNSESNDLKGVICSREECINKIDPDLHYGFLYDPKFNYLFILINSSWFSFGEIPKTATFEKYMEDLVPKGIENTLNRIISIDNNILVELGNQTYAYNLFNKYQKELAEIRKKKPFIISIAHHPPSWLHWKERFSESYKNKSSLSELTSFSNLHLVGHEHNAPLSGTILEGHCLMLNSGMFMDNKIESQNHGDKSILQEDYFPNNWFSIINIHDQIIQHQCFFYDHKSLGNFSWENKQNFIYKFNKDNTFSYIKDTDTDARIDQGLELINSKLPSKVSLVELIDIPVKFNYREYILKKDISTEWIEPPVHNKYKDLTYYISSSYNNKIRFYIGSLNDFVKDDKMKDKFYFNFENWVREAKFNYSDIYISLVDFIAYQDINKEIDKVFLEAFIQEREIIFNSFKHHFFDSLIKNHHELFKIIYDAKITYDIIDFTQI